VPRRDDPPVRPRGGRRQAKPHRRVKRRPFLQSVFLGAYRLLVLLSAIIVVTFLGMKFFIQPPAQAQMEPPPAHSDSSLPPTGDGSGDLSQEEPARVLTPRDKVYNILLAATDKEGFRTDTMMVLCYDIPNQRVGVVSVPRDTLTRRPSGQNPKLVYGPGGVEQRREDISAMLGIPIDYYVQVNIQGFVALVDYLDGVDFYVPCDMDYDDPYQDLSIHFKEGQQHLDGREAMEVARFRKNNDGSGYSDVGRTQTQQKLLVALAKKVLSWNSLTRVNGFVELFDEYVKTDLELSDMLWFASQAIYLNPSEDVETATLEGRGDSLYRGYTYCYELDRAKAVDTVNRLLNPFDGELTLEDMDVLRAGNYMT